MEGWTPDGMMDRTPIRNKVPWWTSDPSGWWSSNGKEPQYQREIHGLGGESPRHQEMSAMKRYWEEVMAEAGLFDDEDATPLQSPSGSQPRAQRPRDRAFGPGPRNTAGNQKRRQERRQERRRKRKRKRKQKRKQEQEQELLASGAKKEDRKRKFNKEKTAPAPRPSWEQDDGFSATPPRPTVADQERCLASGHRINNLDNSCICGQRSKR